VINNKKVLAIIPARGGSVGLPGKNIIDVNGKPLLFYTWNQAQKSKYIDRVILSSEDDEIIRVAKSLGCEVPFTRPKELSESTSGSMPVIFHAIEELDEAFDYVVLLQITSPLRIAEDIDKSIELCEKNNAPSCLSAVANEKPLEWIFRVSDQGKVVPISNKKVAIRRQDATEIFSVNGAVAVAEIEWLKSQDHFLSEETIVHIMPKSRSIDIDTIDDLNLFKYFLSENEAEK